MLVQYIKTFDKDFPKSYRQSTDIITGNTTLAWQKDAYFLQMRYTQSLHTCTINGVSGKVLYGVSCDVFPNASSHINCVWCIALPAIPDSRLAALQ